MIPDGPARRQALEAGDIDGYDLVDPADVGALEEAGFTILRRPAFNVGYIGFQQNVAPFDNLQIRQAIAHAIDKEKLLQTNYPEGSEVATQFMPPELFGWADDVTTYDYDPDRARELIAESGVTDLTLPFWYPTDVSPAVHAEPTGQLRTHQVGPGGRRLHHRAEYGAVEPAVPRRHPDRWNADVPVGMDRGLR